MMRSYKREPVFRAFLDNRLSDQVVMQAESEKVGDTLSAQTHMEFEALLSGALILD